MKAETAALIMMSGKGKPDLEDITINENGEYESVDHDGFGVVTVEVPTMVECAEEVAEILGVDTSQEWDCDDIKTKAQEVVDENEELKEENDELKEENESLQEQLDDCHECKDQVVGAIQQYIPTYDPAPTDCPADEIDDVYQKGRDDEEEENPPGFDFPEGVDIPDIMPFLDKDDIVTPEGNSYSFNYYVFEDIEQKRYPVNYKFEPMVEGKRFQLQGFVEIIDNSTGTVVSVPGITGTIDISPNSDVSWQIIKNEIDYTAKELVTTTHFRDGTYEADWVTRNNILLYLDTTSPNPRYNVRNG